MFGPDGNRIAEYNEATGALIREYVWLDGAPVAVREGGVSYFVRVDHIGRPVFATNSTGTKVWTATYLPFGGVQTTTGSPITLRFPGQWFQSENGLHQNWMRDYDPTTGRYLEADPLGLVDGASVYGYARQNPGRWTDRTGRFVGDGENDYAPGPKPFVTDPEILGPPIGMAPPWRPNFGGLLGGLLGFGDGPGQPGSGDSAGSPDGGAAADSGNDSVAKARERKAYSTYCKTPPPKTGDHCEDLMSNLNHARQCLEMRDAFSTKWYGGSSGDAGHATEAANWRNRVANLEGRLRIECPQYCPPEP